MTTPRTLIEQTTQGLHHFVHNLEQYPAAMHFVTNEDMAVLRQASDILDRMAHRREAADRSLNTDWAFKSRQEDEGHVAINITDRKVMTGWWEIHDNVSFLAQYLATNGESAENIADMVETPWSWTDEYEAAVNEHEMNQAGEQPEGFIQPTHPPRAENQRPTE